MAMGEERLHGRRAIVTGCASGIGRATARRLLDDGAAVFGLDRAWPGGVPPIESGLDGFASVDVSDECSVRTACADALECLGGVDCLVNCAGIEGKLGDVTDLSVSDWDEVFAVNVRGTFLMVRALIEEIAENGGGAIVNVGSDAGVTGVVGFDAYAASKHAVVGLTRCLALAWGRRGVRANVICPGMTATPMAERIASVGDEVEKPDATRNFVPMGRFAQPTEVAATIVFLLSDDAAFVNGAAVSVDGGSSAGYFFEEVQSI